MSDDDRPRKSWREIDKARDRSEHRQVERPDRDREKTGGRSQKSYRSALNKLFETGKIGELVGSPSAEQKEGAQENRFKLMRKVKDAVGRDAISKALDAYLRQFPLPDDLELLGQALEHRDPPVQQVAMQRIESLLQKGEKPRRARAMLGQLKMIRDLSGDPELEQLAQRLIDQL